MSRGSIVLLSRMVVALCSNDEESAATIIHEAGYRTERMDRALAAGYARVMIDSNDRRYTDGKHVQNYLEVRRRGVGEGGGRGH